jgi:hypothetical protein
MLKYIVENIDTIRKLGDICFQKQNKNCNHFTTEPEA